MKTYFIIIITFISFHLYAQETILPAQKQTVPIAITNATVHVGNGDVINNATVLINNGKIAAVGTSD